MIQRNTQFIGEIPQVLKQAELAMFVVHGDMSTLEADAYLIPSDSYASVTERWDWLLEGKREFIHANKALLFKEDPLFLPQLDAESPISMVVNIAGEQATNSVDALGRRFRKALTAFDRHVRTTKNSDVPPWESKRARALLAMPIIGTGQGGLAGETGAVLARLVAEIENFSSELSPGTGCFDIVIVCRSTSDYAALQAVRRQKAGAPSEIIDQLARDAQEKNLTIMFGAGASMPLGLPSWKQLLESLASNIGIPDPEAKALQSLDPIDAASLLIEFSGSEELFREHLRALLITKKASLTHALIASINPKVAVTTNYDKGFEIAVKAATGQFPTVLPWEREQYLSGNYLLKLHGDIDHGQIVLSRDDFAAVHLLRRPLIGIVQEKLLTGHLLTIGSTVSDPTLVQAAEEVGALLTRMNGQNARISGTVLLTKNDLSRSMLLSRHFQVLAAESSGNQRNTTLESARRADIFLDQIAMLSSSNFSFALDPKYAGMLTSEDQKTVAALTRLIQDVDVTDSHAPKSGLGTHVAGFLRDLGA